MGDFSISGGADNAAPHAAMRKSGEGVLGGIGQGLGLVVSDVLDAQELEDLEQVLANVSEGHSAVMGVALLHQHVTVEAAHFGDGEDADAAEGAGSNVQNLTLSDVGAEHALAVALQAVEGHGAGGDVALEGAAGDVGLGAFGLKHAVLDQLVLDRAVSTHLAGGGVAAVEAHEGLGQAVVELAGDVLVVDVAGHGVVDVQQSDGSLVTQAPMNSLRAP